MFFYQENAPRSNVTVDVWKMDAVKAYMRHYENWLFLTFIYENGTDAEKRQAAAEIKICERKLTFWERHPNYVAETVRVEKEKMLNNWKRGGRQGTLKKA